MMKKLTTQFTQIITKVVNLYLELFAKIPEANYFPLFVILSLYFVVPYSEFVVTAAAILYFSFKKKINKFIADLPLPDYLKVGGSVLFFLVMINDYLLYALIIALSYWSARHVKKDSSKTAPPLPDPWER